MNSNYICLKISKAIIQGREIINICTNMIRAILMKYDRDYNNNMKYFLAIIATDDKEDENMHMDPTAIIEENIHLEIIKPKKQYSFKPYMYLSIRRKVERLYEIKRLMVKIVNPPKDKNEYINQFIHVAEDILNSFYKMKGTNAKIMNNNALEIDSCGIP